MPIVVECVCGGKLKAPDHLAGKKARCPKCKRVLAVPATAPPQIPSPPAPAVTAAPPQQNDALPLADEELIPLADGPLEIEPEPMAAAPNWEQIAAQATPDAPLTPSTEIPATAPPVATDPQFNVLIDPTSTRIQQREAGAEAAPKSIGTVLGKPVTVTRVIKWVCCLAIIIAIAMWWFRIPVTMIEIQAVDAIILLDGASEYKKPLIERSLDARKKEKPDYFVGGGGRAIVTHPNPDGDHILIRFDAPQKFLRDNGLDSRYDIAFDGTKFELRQGAKIEKAHLLKLLLPSGHGFKIGHEGGISPKPLYPQSFPPSETVIHRKSELFEGGSFIFDGSNGATGEIRYQATQPELGIGLGSLGSNGSLSAQGSLNIVAKAMNIDYEFNGYNVELFVGNDDALWYAATTYKEHEDMLPYKRWQVTLLFKRPAQTGAMSLHLSGKRIGVIRNDFATQNAGAFTSGSAPARKGPKQLPPAPKTTVQSKSPTRAPTATGAAGRIKSILERIQAYRDNHNDKWPESIVELISFDPEIAQIMRDGKRWAFIYDKPDKGDDLKLTPILIQALDGKRDPKGLRGYADGRVE